ncbi:MAG: hypothetical protein V1494_01685 [Candidatus Diapherotrites archaeon]
MKKNGFVVSLDALFSLLVAFLLLATSAYYFSQAGVGAFQSNQLKRFSNDALAVLEKSGALEKAVKDNKTNDLKQFLNRLPSNYCFSLKIFSANDLNNAVLSTATPSCPADYSELSSAQRSFIVSGSYNRSFYLAELNGWLK